MNSLLKKISILIVAVMMTPFSAFAATSLMVFEWEGYISPFEEEFEAYAKERGLEVDLKFFPTNITSPDDVFETARRGWADIITPTHNYFKAENGKLFNVLAPIEIEKLSNYQAIAPSLTAADYDKYYGEAYSIPLIGGAYSLAYNTSRVPEPKSWQVFLQPENKGRFTLTKQQFEANLYVVFSMLGLPPQSFYNIDDNPHFKADIAQEKLNALVANAGDPWLGLAGDFGEGFDLERFDELSYAATYGLTIEVANRFGKSWKMAKPAEGHTIWLDTISISKHAVKDPAKKEAAYLLLDFMISKAIQQKMYDLYQVVMVHEQVQMETGNSDFYADTRYLWQPLPRRTRNFYKLMWDRAVKKSGKNW